MSTRWIRSLALPILAIGLAWLSSGCAPKSSTDESAPQVNAGQNEATSMVEKAREAGRMAVELEREPNRVAEILAAHGMTPEAYQNLLYQIAEDPALTEAYESARTGSS